GGGTGGLTTIGAVGSWTYTPTTQGLPPLAPSNLKVANVLRHDNNTSDIQVTWTCNSFNETGVSVERSTDGVRFSQIATLGANAMTFTDSRVGAGTFYYRARAFNADGFSSYSNVDSTRIGEPGQLITLDHSAGFASHNDLVVNGSAVTFPNTDPVRTFPRHH